MEAYLQTSIKYSCRQFMGRMFRTKLSFFHKCLECANEHRQIAEWLKKLGNYEDGIEKIKEQINYFKGLDEWTEANAMEYALELLGVYKGEEVYQMKMGAVKDDRKAGDS